jgi:hypothetical protein
MRHPLTPLQMLLEMYEAYGRKKLTGFVPDPLHADVIGQFSHGYKNEISHSWEPVYSKQLEANNFGFIPDVPTIVSQSIAKKPVGFGELFETEATPLNPK